MASYPIRIEIDLPKPVVDPAQPGYAYEHRFTGTDANYSVHLSGTTPTIWRDPIRHTVMLMPYQLTDDFNGSTGGLLARPKLAHYLKDNGSVSEDWEEVGYRIPENTFLMSQVNDQRLTTSKKWRPNQPFFFRAWPFGEFDKRAAWFELELGKSSLTGTPHFKIVVRFDGSFNLYKDGAETPILTDYFAPGGVDRLTLHGKPFELMILPYRRNQILFWTNQGSYPIFTDYDLDSLKPNGGSYNGQEGYGHIAKTDSVIVKYGHVGVKFPASKGYFQLTPVVFLSDSAGNGMISTQRAVELPYAPDSALFPEGEEERRELDADLKADLEVIASLSPNLDLDGVDTSMNWTVVLHGHRPDPDDFPTICDESPYVYGFSYSVPAVPAETDDDPAPLTDYVRKLTRTYTEEGSSCELEFKDPRTVSELLMTALNREIRIYRETSPGEQDELFYGVATEPEFEQWAAHEEWDEEAEEMVEVDHTPVRFKVRDHWHTFEQTLMQNFRALDGMRLDLAIREVLKKGGWDMTRVDIDECPVYLPKDERADEKLVLADQVGTLKDQLLMLRDTYTSSNIPPYKWIMDFAPVLVDGLFLVCFRFKDPETQPDYVGGGQTRSWYAKKADAVTAGATKEDWARSYTRRVIEPEANYIEAWGQTPEGTPIKEIGQDLYSQNKDTPLEDRPLNWIGRLRAVLYVNPALNTSALVKAAAYTLLNRLSSPRIMAEWEGEHSYDDRLWDLHRMTHDGNRKYWLREFSVEHILETETQTIRNARYVGEARS